MIFDKLARTTTSLNQINRNIKLSKPVTRFSATPSLLTKEKNVHCGSMFSWKINTEKMCFSDIKMYAYLGYHKRFIKKSFKRERLLKESKQIYIYSSSLTVTLVTTSHIYKIWRDMQECLV